MKTGNNLATNNFIIRIWSKAHYKEDKEKFTIRWSGSITEVKSKKEVKFHSAGDLLKNIEKMNKEAEKERRKK